MPERHSRGGLKLRLGRKVFGGRDQLRFRKKLRISLDMRTLLSLRGFTFLSLGVSAGVVLARDETVEELSGVIADHLLVGEILSGAPDGHPQK